MTTSQTPITLNDEWIIDSSGKVVGVQRNVGSLSGDLSQTFSAVTTNPITGGSRILAPTGGGISGLRYAILGDSFGQRCWNGLSYRMMDYGYFTWANSFLGSPFSAGQNFGVAGENTVEIASRVSQVIDYGPDWCFLNGGINDAGDGIPIDTAISSVKSTALSLLNEGIKVCLLSVTPYTGHADAAWRAHRQNMALREWARYVPNLVFVDCYGPMVNPTDASGNLASGMSGDALHPSAKGARAMGYAIAQAIGKYITTPTILPSSASESWATNANDWQLYSNPLFTGSSGSLLGGATGTVATSWSAGVSSGTVSSCACSLVARSDGMGNNQRIVASGGGSGGQIQIRQGTLQSRLTMGKRIALAAEVKISGCTDVASIGFQFLVTMDGVTRQIHAFDPGSSVWDQADMGPLILRTPDFLLNGAAVTSFNTFIQVTFGTSGAGAATLEMGRAAVYQF